MAKFIIRSAAAFHDWSEIDIPLNVTLEDMANRLKDPTGQSDLGFVGHLMETLFNPHGNFTVEVWDCEFSSFQNGVLEICVVWSYFHNRLFPTRDDKFRIMEGTL